MAKKSGKKLKYLKNETFFEGESPTLNYSITINVKRTRKIYGMSLKEMKLRQAQACVKHIVYSNRYIN